MTRHATTTFSRTEIVQSRLLSPLFFTILELSWGKESIKNFLTPHIFVSFTEGAKCLVYFFFLCRYEKDMVLLLVRFTLWERS